MSRSPSSSPYSGTVPCSECFKPVPVSVSAADTEAPVSAAPDTEAVVLCGNCMRVASVVVGETPASNWGGVRAGAGKPVTIDVARVRDLRRRRRTWEQVASELGVSKWTAMKALRRTKDAKR